MRSKLEEVWRTERPKLLVILAGITIYAGGHDFGALEYEGFCKC